MYYIDQNGKFLGVFVGYTDHEGQYVPAETPPGAIEVPTAPTDARQVWNGAAWDELPRRLQIIDRLSLLDAAMPRLVEDMVQATNLTLHGKNQAVYAEKQALRAELAGL